MNTVANAPAGSAPLPVPRAALVWLWLATFFGFAAVAHGNFETTDAGFTLHAARAVWERGDSALLRAEEGGDLRSEIAGADWIHHHQALGARRDGKVGTNGRAYTWYPMGHVWLLVPFVAAADGLQAAWPGAEQAFVAHVSRADEGVLSLIEGTPVLAHGLVALVLPPACAASILLLLIALGRRLGADARASTTAALAILLTTQAFALGREQLSDGPGLVFLLGALLAAVAVHQGGGSPRGALAGGLCAGAAFVLRYQNGALLLAIGVALLLACRRQRRWRELAAFALGAAPFAVAFLLTNHARFGNVFDTGYPPAGDWLDQPIWLGVTKILFAAGRGVAWLSPLAWLALPLAWQKRSTPQLRWLALVLLLFPLLFFAQARGWQGGRCWGARYVTHGLVALLAIVLPQAQPWRRWPRTWWTLLAVGAFACLTSVVAPARGVLQLADQAVRARGDVPTGADTADVSSWHPRYTPLLANWRYAFASHAGGFEDAAERPNRASPPAITTVFGAVPRDAGQASPPVRWEDRRGRHLWWRFWGDLTGVPGLVLLAPVLALAALCSFLAARALPRPAPSDCWTVR